MRSALIFVAAALVLAGCDKQKADTAAPDGGGDAGSGPAKSDDDDYGEGAPVFMGDDKTEDINQSETLGTAVETDGSLEPDAVNNVVVGKMDAVGKCYQEGMNRTRNQDLAGVVVVKFVVGPDGTVKSAEPGESSLGDPETGTCLSEAVKTWKFPKPPEGDDVKVTYPFDLKPY